MSKRSDILGYISGPYSKGDVAMNVSRAMFSGAKVMDMGAQVYVPHLSHFFHMAHPRNYQRWIQLDLAILKRCDFLWRIPGYSGGADIEVDAALKEGLHVFYTEEQVLTWLLEQEKES